MKYSDRPSYFEVVVYLKGARKVYCGINQDEAIAAYEKWVAKHPDRPAFLHAVWKIEHERVLRSQKMPPGVPKRAALPKRISVRAG
jgi:hypothetical protein